MISVIQKPDDDHISHLASPKDLQFLTWYNLELWWPRASKYVLSCRYFAAFALAQPSLHWLDKMRWSANVRSPFLAAEVSLTSLRYFRISIAATGFISLVSRWFQNRPRDVFDAYVCVQPLSLCSLDTRLWNCPSREPVPSSACFWHHTIFTGSRLKNRNYKKGYMMNRKSMNAITITYTKYCNQPKRKKIPIHAKV